MRSSYPNVLSSVSNDRRVRQILHIDIAKKLRRAEKGANEVHGRVVRDVIVRKVDFGHVLQELNSFEADFHRAIGVSD
jgi:hypothetical protein